MGAGVFGRFGRQRPIACDTRPLPSSFVSILLITAFAGPACFAGDNPFGTVIVPTMYQASGSASADVSASADDSDFAEVIQNPAEAAFVASGVFMADATDAGESGTASTSYTTSFDLNTETGVLTGTFESTTSASATHTDPERSVPISETRGELRLVFDVVGASVEVAVSGTINVSAGAAPTFASSEIYIYPIFFTGEYSFEGAESVTGGSTQAPLSGMATLEPGTYVLDIRTGGEAYFDNDEDTGTRSFNSAIDVTVTLTPGSAETLFWQPLSGDFEEPSNWEPMQAPNAGDLVIFDKDQSSTVMIDAAEAGRTFVERGVVTFFGGTYVLNGGSPESPSLVVGNTSTDEAVLDLLDDHVLTAPYVTVALETGTNGKLVMGVLGVTATLNAGGRLAIGDGGTGLVELDDGGRLNAGEILLGVTAGGVGDLLAHSNGVSGSPSVSFVSMAVGVNGTAELQVTEDAISGDVLTLGLNAGANGFFTVAGETGLVEFGALTVGDAGQGTATVEGGAQLLARAGLAQTAVLGDTAGGSGDLLATGCGTLFRGGILTVGGDGDGVMAVASGARVEAVSIFVGGGDGDGQLTIRGACEDTPTTVVQAGAGQTALGFNGTGAVTVSEGAMMHSTSAALGVFDGSQGLAVIDGAAWMIDGHLSLGETIVQGDEGPAVGTIVLQNGGMLQTQTFVVRAGSGIYGNGIFSFSPDPANEVEGTIAGGVYTQPIFGAKQSGGPVRGRGHGVLTINGDLVMTGGVLEVGIGGLGAGAFDTIAVDGDVSLEDTTIRLIFTDGFAPMTGAMLPFVASTGAITLTDVVLVYDGLADGFAYGVDVVGGEVVFEAENDGVATSPPAADLNLDGVVNAVDVQLVINGALGLLGVAETDVNFDGLADAVDVQLVVNAALGI